MHSSPNENKALVIDHAGGVSYVAARENFPDNPDYSLALLHADKRKKDADR